MSEQDGTKVYGGLATQYSGVWNVRLPEFEEQVQGVQNGKLVEAARVAQEWIAGRLNVTVDQIAVDIRRWPEQPHFHPGTARLIQMWTSQELEEVAAKLSFQFWARGWSLGHVDGTEPVKCRRATEELWSIARQLRQTAVINEVGPLDDIDWYAVYEAIELDN